MKIKFQLPAKAQILFYEMAFEEHLSPLLEKYSRETLQLRGESINLWAVILSLFTKDFWKRRFVRAYSHSFIKLVKPDLIITAVDESAEFWEIANFFPTARTLLIQNGRRFSEYDIFDGRKISESARVDFKAVFSEAIREKYDDLIPGSQSIVVGSIKNNGIERRISDYSKPKILFLSEFEESTSGSPFRVLKDGTLLERNDFFAPEKLLLPELLRFSVKHDVDFEIAGRTPDNQGVESTFFENLGIPRAHFRPRIGPDDSYRAMDLARIVITVDSTLGYEALARGVRVFHFGARGSVMKDPSFGFGWPNPLHEEGDIWSNSMSIQGLSNRISELISMSDAEWTKLANEYGPLVMEWDPGNQRIAGLVDNILKSM